MKRYWVMAATYDGVTTALSIWAVVWAVAGVGIDPAYRISGWAAAAGSIAFALAAWACRREAQRYANYQLEEVVASLATGLEPLHLEPKV
jgi:hypothetical protein